MRTKHTHNTTHHAAKKEFHASEDDRNPDLSIFSAALSQLSYRGS